MSLERLTENVYLQRHPLVLAGCRMGRVVTLIRLETGKVLIHSTAEFSPSDLSDIREVGEPGWILEATNFHDSTARAGRAVFRDIPYLVPPGFPRRKELGATVIDGGAPGWDGEFEVIPIRGMPKLNEHALFHVPSKTLVVGDLFFNLSDAGWWTRWFLRSAARIRQFPGQSALFRHYIEDRDAYRDSLLQIADRPFERIVVGHGEPVSENARLVFESLLDPA